MVHTPDLWTLIEITTSKGEKIQKILGSWYGGWGGSDSWRLSSGCLTPTIKEGIITWPQSSGSSYSVGCGNIGMSGYTRNILAVLKQQAYESGFSIVELDTKQHIEDLFV